jgi:tRNA-specific adenosine deaminase 1
LKRTNSTEEENVDDEIGSEVAANESDRKRQKLTRVDANNDENETDIHRTGARCVPNSERKDPKEKGEMYHVTGVLRTKPGRGDPTISMSCSDKIAKWLVLGVQGAMLSVFFKNPIYLDALIVGQ